MAKKRLASPEHADTLSLKALRELVTGLVDEVSKLSAEVTTLRAENAALREDNAALRLENTRLKVDNQPLRDEIARLKNLPPRPPFRPSGMEKATDDKRDAPQAASKKPRGPKRDLNRVRREQILHVDVPPGSRFKGYKSCHVRELIVTAELVH
jgi:regulator of replication initiation timing